MITRFSKHVDYDYNKCRQQQQSNYIDRIYYILTKQTLLGSTKPQNYLCNTTDIMYVLKIWGQFTGEGGPGVPEPPRHRFKYLFYVIYYIRSTFVFTINKTSALRYILFFRTSSLEKSSKSTIVDNNHTHYTDYNIICICTHHFIIYQIIQHVVPNCDHTAMLLALFSFYHTSTWGIKKITYHNFDLITYNKKVLTYF